MSTKIEPNTIHQGDCLEVMKDIPDGSVDMVLCDLPYGTTNAEWDIKISLKQLWKEYERVISEGGVIVLTASQPFSSELVMSNLKLFKYEWIWVKSKPSGHLNAKNQPMRQHETILVFAKKLGTYNSTGILRQEIPVFLQKVTKPTALVNGQPNPATYRSTGHARSILYYSNATGKLINPTQKPLDLFRYLVRTYTNPGELVLDNTMGSGTTCVAAIAEGRNYIGIEKDDTQFRYAKLRINRALRTKESQK